MHGPQSRLIRHKEYQSSQHHDSSVSDNTTMTLSARQTALSMGMLLHAICSARPTLNIWVDADEIGELRRRENEMQVEPDWEIDAFMKASVRHGKRHNIRTDYTLRLLGLEVNAVDLA